jgi:hypothetical protein
MNLLTTQKVGVTRAQMFVLVVCELLKRSSNHSCYDERRLFHPSLTFD